MQNYLCNCESREIIPNHCVSVACPKGICFVSLRCTRNDNIQLILHEYLKQPQPIVAYSYQTQQYLRRRVWRTLKKLGENGDANYIKMATAILLEYSDDDDAVVVRSQFSKWDNYTRDIKQYWDKYADYLTFNHILYSNSPRYFFNSKKWFRRRGCDVDTEITVREEAFPRLWEEYPQALLKLLLESQCLAVHRFAVKVLRDCEDFCAELDDGVSPSMLSA